MLLYALTICIQDGIEKRLLYLAYHFNLLLMYDVFLFAFAPVTFLLI